MKNLTRIFVAVAALVALSCTTDATEDLGVQVGNGVSQTTIALSLEGTKTHLGEKVDNIYSLYWSEGDRIAINGKPSDPLTAEDDGKTTALFNVEGELTYPYNIVYPAPTTKLNITLDGTTRTTEGAQTVTFLAAQPYKAGSFAEGAAPLYAQVAAEGDKIELKHLSGVLCFAPKGEGVTLTSMTVTSETGKIAGNFDVDCATGALTAHEDASNTITVSFGEGLTLGAEATPIYVAVPAGEYGLFAVSFHTATDSMLVKFSTKGEKAVKAGVVREFGEFVYSASAIEEDIFEIYDEASLRRFAAIAPTFYPRKGAKLMNNIDLTGKEWTTIEGFGAYEFDGNGKKIIGLTAPLFGTTNASIKNLHLENLDLNITDNRHIVGGIACVLQSTADATAKLDGCTVSGKVTFATTYESTASDTDMALSPMVAQAFGAQISNCQNNASITITTASAKTTKNTYMCVAGIVGYMDKADGATAEPLLTNCVNNESATILWEEGTVSSSKHSPYIAGVVGRYFCANGLSNCTNYADITAKTDISVVNIGGVCGYIYVNETSKLYNYGDVTFDAACGYAYWGGVIGSCYNNVMSVTNCENYGKVEFGKNGSCTHRFYMAGVIGTSQSSGATYSNLKNHGTIASYGDNTDSRFFVGGVIGYCWKVGELSNCVNGAEGDATKGKIIVGGTIGQTNEEYYTNIGGVVGYFYPNGGTYLLKSCTNYAPMTLGFTTAGTYNYNIGGVAGYSNKGVVEECHNYGAVDCTDLNNAAAQQMLIGGVVGYVNRAANNCSNSGDITIGANADGRLQLGGVFGYQTALTSNCSNSGAITINSAVGIANPAVVKVRSAAVANRSDGDVNNRSNIGGVIGRIYGKSLEGTFTNLRNTGAISLPQADSLNCTAIGGVLGEAIVKNITLSNSHNEGNISIANTNAEAALVSLGGVLGRNFNITVASMTINIDGCSNKGNITLTENNAIRHTRAGGIVGDLVSAGASKFEAIVNITNCENYGNISRSTKTKADFESYAGGIVAAVGVSPGNADESLMATALTVSGCTNNGSVQFDQYNGTKVVSNTSWSYNSVGGIIGMIYGGLTNGTNKYVPTITGCRNKGKVLARCGAVGGIVGLIRDWGHITGTEQAYNVNEGEVVLEGTIDGFVGGIVGYLNETDHTNRDIQVSHCANKGKITGHYRVGGIIGTSTTTNNEAIKDCVNIGYLQSSKKEAKTTVGGIVGMTTSYITNCQSHCKIEALQCTVGFITAASRTETTLAQNCQVGGAMLGEYDTEDEEYKTTALDASNYFNYIYGSGEATDWGSSTNYDGCTLLESVPTIK